MLGLERVMVLEVARDGEGRLHVAIETTDVVVACRWCGVRAEAKDRDLVGFADLPAFETATERTFEDYNSREVFFIARVTLRESIGAQLRDEVPKPKASEDWTRLRKATIQAIERYKASLRRPGFNASSSIDSLE